MKVLLLVLIVLSGCCKKEPAKCKQGEVVQIGGCDKGGDCSALVKSADGSVFKVGIIRRPVVGETYKSYDCE